MSADPIFAAIARHRSAQALHTEVLAASSEDWPTFDDPVVIKACDDDNAAWFDLVNTRPTTRAGFTALGEYLTADAERNSYDALESIKSLARGGARLLAEEIAITGIMGAGA